MGIPVARAAKLTRGQTHAAPLYTFTQMLRTLPSRKKSCVERKKQARALAIRTKGREHRISPEIGRPCRTPRGKLGSTGTGRQPSRRGQSHRIIAFARRTSPKKSDLPVPGEALTELRKYFARTAKNPTGAPTRAVTALVTNNIFHSSLRTLGSLEPIIKKDISAKANRSATAFSCTLRMIATRQAQHTISLSHCTPGTRTGKKSPFWTFSAVAVPIDGITLAHPASSAQSKFNEGKNRWTCEVQKLNPQ